MATKRIKINQTILASFLACVLTLSFVFDSTKVLAIPDVQYYSGNDILLFDPDAVRCSASSGGGGGSTLRGADKREKIWNYLVDKGLSPEQAAGVMGNMSAESGFSPTRRQSTSDMFDSKYLKAWGLAQWDGGRRFSSPDKGILGKFRKEHPELMKYTANEYGGPGDDKKIPVEDLDKILIFELDYLYEESKSRRVTAEGFGRAANEWETLKLQKTITKATVFWHNNFEVSADSEIRVMETRGGAANQAFKDFGSKTGKVGAADGADCSATGSGASGDLATKIGTYVWPTYHSPPYANNRYGYQEAQKKAGNGAYRGGGTNGQLGVDCGGFVTRLVIDSGFDPSYNHSGKTGKGAGPTSVQQAWASANWTGLGKGGKRGNTMNPADLKPGDVAFSPGHTFIFVGGTGKQGDPKITILKEPRDGISQDTTLGAGDKNWHGVASASISFTGQSWRSPMAGHESLTSSSVTWYRK